MDTELLQRLFTGLILPAIIIIEAFQIIYFFRKCKDVKGIRELLTNRVNADAMNASQISELQKENQLLKEQITALYQQNQNLEQQNQALMNAFEIKKTAQPQ